MRHVGLRRLRIAHLHRRVAGGRLAPRAAGVAEDTLGQARETDQILVDEGVVGAAEATEPVLDVGGITRLAHLAVVDDVDTGGCLLAHDLGHRVGHALRQCRGIDRHAFFLGVHHFDQVVRPRQAAGVGGQKAVGAALHRSSFARSVHRTGIPQPRRRSPAAGSARDDSVLRIALKVATQSAVVLDLDVDLVATECQRRSDHDAFENRSRNDPKAGVVQPPALRGPRLIGGILIDAEVAIEAERPTDTQVRKSGPAAVEKCLVGAAGDTRSSRSDFSPNTLGPNRYDLPEIVLASGEAGPVSEGFSVAASRMRAARRVLACASVGSADSDLAAPVSRSISGKNG